MCVCVCVCVCVHTSSRNHTSWMMPEAWVSQAPSLEDPHTSNGLLLFVPGFACSLCRVNNTRDDSPWTSRRSNQSIEKEISPDYSLEGLMLKLKLQYFSHLMWRANSLEKTLMLCKIQDRSRGDDRGWYGWMASLTQWTWVWASSESSWWTGRPGVLQSMGLQRVGHDWATKLNWITMNYELLIICKWGYTNWGSFQISFDTDF